MLVRSYTEADYGKIRELHSRSKFDYDLPQPSGKVFFSRRVAGDDASIGMAAFLKLTAEAYLVCDPEWRTPAWRLEAIRQLSLQCNSDAKQAGVTEVVSFLPPQVEATFGKRLTRMGWDKCREDWHCWYKGVI